MKSKKIPGVNIQWPWSKYIVDGKKTVETRTYPMPTKYEGVELAIIETPGPHGRKKGLKKARIIGTVVFSESFQYDKVKWKNDIKKHLVDINDPQFSWDEKKEKWGWKVKKVRKFKVSKPAPAKKGIVFASACDI